MPVKSSVLLLSDYGHRHHQACMCSEACHQEGFFGWIHILSCKTLLNNVIKGYVHQGNAIRSRVCMSPLFENTFQNIKRWKKLHIHPNLFWGKLTFFVRPLKKQYNNMTIQMTLFCLPHTSHIKYYFSENLWASTECTHVYNRETFFQNLISFHLFLIFWIVLCTFYNRFICTTSVRIILMQRLGSTL
jgi:hypothetical protein